MAIYLVQHGLAYSREEDPGRGLTREGKEKVRLIGEVAANYGVKPRVICHSGKTRAMETAQILAECLGVGRIEVREGMAPNDAVTPFANTIDSFSELMLVGHLPFLERLTSQLITGATDFLPFKFQNGGIVCLDREEMKAKALYHVRWALMPNVG